jgi:hypothetical protein
VYVESRQEWCSHKILYTEYYGTCNLNNLLKFIDLRTHEGAQQEIQDAARACLEIAQICGQKQLDLIGIIEVFKKGDLFFLNEEGLILFQYIDGENGIIMTDGYLLVEFDHGQDKDKSEFTGYDVIIKGRLFKEIPEKFLLRVIKNEKNTE